ncbi:hypothetical protein HBZS_112720 [Helicobacter bizzozeronii CCUG 35545]|nr:hypothetical protein HBZS_112720 [Helicobacter bizzozeronii CCUG 35545]
MLGVKAPVSRLKILFPKQPIKASHPSPIFRFFVLACSIQGFNKG